jgi:hypothetical protein
MKAEEPIEAFARKRKPRAKALTLKVPESPKPESPHVNAESPVKADSPTPDTVKAYSPTVNAENSETEKADSPKPETEKAENSDANSVNSEAVNAENSEASPKPETEKAYSPKSETVNSETEKAENSEANSPVNSEANSPVNSEAVNAENSEASPKHVNSETDSPKSETPVKAESPKPETPKPETKPRKSKSETKPETKTKKVKSRYNEEFIEGKQIIMDSESNILYYLREGHVFTKKYIGLWDAKLKTIDFRKLGADDAARISFNDVEFEGEFMTREGFICADCTVYINAEGDVWGKYDPKTHKIEPVDDFESYEA